MGVLPREAACGAQGKLNALLWSVLSGFILACTRAKTIDTSQRSASFLTWVPLQRELALCSLWSTGEVGRCAAVIHVVRLETNSRANQCQGWPPFQIKQTANGSEEGQQSPPQTLATGLGAACHRTPACEKQILQYRRRITMCDSVCCEQTHS